MPALASDLRKTLENTVVKARDKAEGGARDALTALAVDASEPFGSMSEEERKLRNRLRARGRQLGDQRDPQKGSQGIERLVREMAYEHWHRMLFARFLAENQLLIEPSSGVSITLDECEELAAEEGTDLWGLAAQFAQEMLPQIFRGDDPVLAAKLPLEIRQQLQGLVAGLETETFTASDSLGWTYQFWQTKRKKEVNDSGVKIGADEISPVTQLFTEDYMVDFLLDNTLGAWHAGKVLAANPQLAATAQSEEELRQAAALPGCLWSYLRFVKSDDGLWAPAAGTFAGWPKTGTELKCLDPCMGSGHFVVAMFERLVALRMEEEGVSEQSAVAAVIQDNLFGLEIDPRCTQIGAFNLALAAWRRVGHCKLPAMNLACSGLAPNIREADWLALAGDNERLRNGMKRLYQLFDNAAVLGSLVNPRAEEADLLMAGFTELQPLLEQALVLESKDSTANELAVTARGLTKAADILASRFTLVATNVPYLGRGKQDLILRKFSEKNHLAAKAELATTFVERCASFSCVSGTSALVTPQSWWFQESSKDLRVEVLMKQTERLIATLGEEAWQSFGGRGPVTVLMILQNHSPDKAHVVCGLDALPRKTILEKEIELQTGQLIHLTQLGHLSNPDHRITIQEGVRGPLLQDFADSYLGLGTGDAPHYTRAFWELPLLTEFWSCLQAGPSEQSSNAGREQIVAWDKVANRVFGMSDDERKQGHNQDYRGRSAWGRKGIAISLMRTLRATAYEGDLFEKSIAVLVPKTEDVILAIKAFTDSPEYPEAVRKLDKKVMVTNATLVKVPFDLERWQKVAAESYPHGLPRSFSSDPTQWLFNGHPAGADQPLHVAVARLVGYLWPRQTGSSFPDCPTLEPDDLDALVDVDGIVCMAPVRGEASAVERLRKLLATAVGEEWSSSKERELLLATAVENNAKKPEPDLDSWLRSSFFSEHCKLFQSRPFIWQIWDGHPHGFSALVNYHKLTAPKGQGRKTSGVPWSGVTRGDQPRRSRG
jgi:hypothetical protein